ncbi:unnamed protein product [Acanthoscelides obtectus]|uniref:Uncharacterized protein n=1 Tax=Acanthoscelides obtectus TaxID=200917 RepID=A0A9P0M364_ACAOB|nr:unnamed protein product [Acanthoscelides obtectus]CAK1640637.1 hypothetical protein AOBTE_LOCUS11834 [Acanthoscelides obtectus]
MGFAHHQIPSCSGRSWLQNCPVCMLLKLRSFVLWHLYTVHPTKEGVAVS